MLIENIAVTVKRKNIKNMYIRVLAPNGDVKVSAPIFVSDAEIIDFVKSKKEWILKKQKYILENDIKAPLKYDNGENHFIWGKEYNMQLISNRNVKHAFINENTLYLPIPKRSTIEKIVDDVKAAVSHISEHSTHHSESIITETKEIADYFTSMVDSAAVYVNASTRFTDGGEFGLGCEMGISTQKLHARGPMGLMELNTYKYIIEGNGQVR